MSLAKEQAQEFLSKCNQYGFQVEVRGTSVVSISKSFCVGDKESYAGCEMDSDIILSLAPLKGGSTWGTDSASVGGYVALRSGRFQMNKSGSGARFINALKGLLA